MSKLHEIDCWKCGEQSTLKTRSEFDGCCWACGAEIDLEDYLARAMDERDQLSAEVERLRMQLAACGVVAMSNTPESAAKARDMHPDYMSASCQDVMRVVDREMALRAAVEAMRKDAERYRFIADNACDVIMSASMTDYGDGDTTSGPRVEVAPDQYPTGIFGTAKTKLDAAIDAAMAAKEVNP